MSMLPTLVSDTQRPSFFEMWQVGTLLPSLKPALSYALTILSQRRPGWEWILKYLDELFALCQVRFWSLALRSR